MAYAINDNPGIKGIKIKEKEFKLTQYADDTTCFMENEESIHNLLILLESFKTISGLEININKTEAMWIGSSKDNTSHPLGLNWTSEPILALGIYFTYNTELSNQLNFYEKLKILENCLCIWKKRNLSIYGKINIVKTVGLSKLNFNSSVLPVPDNFAEEVDKITFNFIWNDKPAKIKKRTIIGTK